MKVQLIGNPKESFDVPRSTGLLLIAAGTCEAYKEPPPDPAALQVKWSIYGSADDLTRIPLLKADCPACHMGVTMESVRAFVHCRGIHTWPPSEHAEKLNALIKLRNKGVRERMEQIQQTPVKIPTWI